MHVQRALNENSCRKIVTPVHIFIDCPVSKKYCQNYCFSSNPKSVFVAHYDQGKTTKRKETFQCHYCDVLFRYKSKFNKHIKWCTGRPGFIYCFQNDSLETYEKYLRHKKDFLFTVAGDLEKTTGYKSKKEGGSMFPTSYCLMFNFHPKLNMTPITYVRSFGQTEEELKFITIPEIIGILITTIWFDFETRVMVFYKRRKNRPSGHMYDWDVVSIQNPEKYFGTVVKPNDCELPIAEKENFHSFAEFNPRDRKVTHCYLCECPIDSKICYGPDVLIAKSSRLDFLIRKEYLFLKNVFTEQEIKESTHLSSLPNYYDAMNYLIKVFQNLDIIQIIQLLFPYAKNWARNTRIFCWPRWVTALHRNIYTNVLKDLSF